MADDSTGAMEALKKQFVTLPARVRSQFRSWVTANYTETGEAVSQAPIVPERWKEFIDAAQSLESFFESARAHMYHWERNAATDPKEYGDDLSRTHAALMLFVDKGMIIERMRETFAERPHVAEEARRFEEYCSVLEVSADSRRWPDKNDLLRRRGVKIGS